MSGQQFELAQNPEDTISAVQFSPSDNKKLLVSSWDRHVYLYDIEAESGGKLLQKYEYEAPILDACFGSDNEIFTAGLDWDVRRLNLENGEQTVLSTHEAAVSKVVYSKEHSLLISGSYDSTLHLHALASEYPTNTTAILRLPSKVFSLSLTPTKLVVAMANRAVYIYEMNTLGQITSQSIDTPAPNFVDIEPWQRRESSMKYMTRAVACMPNDAGYASSSIEGRVAVEWFDPSAESQSRKYAFKCHRETVDGQDVVYPVHALAFHPVHGTFVSGGGNAVVALWDGVAKRRIRQYAKYPSSIAAMSFSGDGRYMAVAVSPSYEDEKQGQADGVFKVFIKELADGEAAGKGKK